MVCALSITSADRDDYLKQAFTQAVLPEPSMAIDHRHISDTIHDIRLTNSEITTSATALQCIATVGGFRDAQKFGALGSIAGELYTNMSLLALSGAESGSMGICAAQPYVAIGSCILSAIGLMSNDRGNGLGEAFAQISQQLSIFYDHVMIRFDELEQQLDLHHRKVMRAFFELHKYQERMHEEIVRLHTEVTAHHQQIHNALRGIESAAMVRHQETLEQFAQLRLENIEGTLSDIDFAIKTDSVDSKKIVEFVRQLHKHVNIVAKSSVLTGRTDLESKRAIIEALSGAPDDNVYNHPAFSNINMLRSYCQMRGVIQEGSDVINPCLWVRCASSLNQLLNHVQKLSFETEGIKAGVLSDIDEIAHMGHSILTTIEQMAKPETIELVAKDCIDTLGILKNLTDNYMIQHVDASLKKDMLARIQEVAQADLTALATLESLRFFDLQRVLRPRDALNIDRMSEVALATIVQELFKESENRLSAWKDHVSQTAKKRIEAIQAGSAELSDVPLRQLAFPSKSPLLAGVTRPVLCETLRVAPEYVQAELCGLGAIVTEFDIIEKRRGGAIKDEMVPFYIRVYFVQGTNKTLLKEYKTDWKEMVYFGTITDEHVYGHMCGGARLTTAMFGYYPEIHGQTQTSWGHTCYGDGDAMVKYLPHTKKPGANFAAVTPISYESVHSSMVKQLVEALIYQKRGSCNAEIKDQLESSTENQFSVTANHLDMNYKVFDAIAVLIKNAQYRNDPACALFHARNILTPTRSKREQVF